MSVKDVVAEKMLSHSGRFSDKQIAETLQLVVAHGAGRGASTIHIEPHGKQIVVRYRIDGALRGVHKLPAAALPVIVKQLKFLADLNPEETDLPQEGRFTIDVDNEPVEVRIATMPVVDGEKAVLHLAPKRGMLSELEALGFWGNSLNLLHETLARPQGLIIVSGLRRSGRTTTLYSLLKLLNNPTHSIATIEETSTYKLPGSSQSYIPARMGVSMADGLRAVLKQDANVIMLGSLPNKTVFGLAVQAATSGHLVLAKLYEASAAGAIARVRAAGVEPFLLASALRLSINQRLVRALCIQCRERYLPDDQEVRTIEKYFGISSAAHRTRIRELEREAMQAGIGGDAPDSTDKRGATYLWRAAEGGCNACDRTGYRGSTAVIEILANTEAIQKRLMKPDLPSTPELHKLALKDDFVPLGLDGLIKALRGLTTIAEITRALPPAS